MCANLYTNLYFMALKPMLYTLILFYASCEDKSTLVKFIFVALFVGLKLLEYQDKRRNTMEIAKQ